MSLTVSRLMELPSLRRAKVLGGRGGVFVDYEHPEKAV